MMLLSLRTVTDCPVCRQPGRPPSAPSSTPLDVYRCLTSGCPVRSFFPFDPDLDDP